MLKSGFEYLSLLGGDHLKRSGSWQTWLVVAALVIFAGVASAVAPFLFDQFGGGAETETLRESQPAVTSIDVSQLPFIGEVLVEIPILAENIQGQPITLIQALGIALGVVLISVGALGILITVITLLFSKSLTNVYTDDSYQESTAKLEQQQKETIKRLETDRPIVGPVEPERRARGSILVFAFIVIVLVWITSILVGFGMFQGETIAIANVEIGAVGLISLLTVLITIVVLYFLLRNRDPVELESPESDNYPVNWGAIWVIVTGMLIVGIGTGLAVALTSIG